MYINEKFPKTVTAASQIPILSNTVKANVRTALGDTCYKDSIITFSTKNFILSFYPSCTFYTVTLYSVMFATPREEKITSLTYSVGTCESRKQEVLKTTITQAAPTTTTATISKSTRTTLISTRTRTHEKHECQSRRTRATKKVVGEKMVTSPTSMPTEQLLELWSYPLIQKDVENLQITTHSRDNLHPHSSLALKQQPLAAAATAVAAAARISSLPTASNTAAAKRNFRKQCLNIKMSLRHLILTIIAVVVFSMVEFTICTSTLMQQQLTTMKLSNSIHLPLATNNKYSNINDSLPNLPMTSRAKITSSKGAPLLFPSSVSSPSTATTSLLSSPPSLTLTTHSRPIMQPLESAALVENSPSALSSLTTSTLDDSPSVSQAFVTETETLTHTESPAYSSLQWNEDDPNGSSELSLSTSILNTYNASDLPPLSEAEQAAKDLLTKGFSIPTYLPPFPVFAVADLPAYLNTVSTTTTEAPIDHPQLSNGYTKNAQGDFLYFDNLPPGHQFQGRHQNHHKLQTNSSMAAANVTVQVGSHAYLPCHIHRLQNKPVSWVRLRDGHIISVDQTTFIADQRFQAIFQDDKEFTWSLQIKYVKQTDEGWYECQASSEPKMSAKVFLKVIVPLTELIGDQSRFVKAGSKVALHCIVRGTLEPPQYIIWYHDKAQIGENNKMGWYTQLDRNIFGNNGDNQNTIGSLIIPFVRKMDSGNYTCQPSNSASVSVDLHVLSGEYSASAIMSAAQTYKLNVYYQLLLLFLLLLLQKT